MTVHAGDIVQTSQGEQDPSQRFTGVTSTTQWSILALRQAFDSEDRGTHIWVCFSSSLSSKSVGYCWVIPLSPQYSSLHYPKTNNHKGKKTKLVWVATMFAEGWWILNKSSQISNSARSVMMSDISRNQMQQITFILMLELDSSHCTFHQSRWYQLVVRSKICEGGGGPRAQHGILFNTFDPKPGILC